MVALDEGAQLAKARRLAFLAADVDGPAPVILGRVWEGSLPYATGRTDRRPRAERLAAFHVDRLGPVVSLSAHSRGYAAVLESGNVLTISTRRQAASGA